jgi:pyruvate/2-oxoglutarate dehydrogenase complex dihydrolipoamide acyltransferase (E2) component
MPQLGESIAEATIVRFCVEPGDQLEADQEVLEVETSKAVMGVTTPCAGRLERFEAQIDETYPIGAILGYVEASVEDAERLTASGGSPIAQPESALPATPVRRPEPAEQVLGAGAERGLAVPAGLRGSSYLSPRVRARMEELGLHVSELGAIPGSGRGGRVTIDDFEQYVEKLAELPTQKASAMRLAVADSMRRSWSRPLATIGTAIPMEPILSHRKTLDHAPGPALYIAKALAIALRESPQYGGRLVGEKLVLPDSIDIGIAVEVPDGVIVPVIKRLDELALSTLAERYSQLVEAARRRRLPEEAKGETVASVTNFGTLGITWATPIPLPGETLIAGLGKAEMRPVWNAEAKSFEPKLLAELTITFDHRVIDGGASGKLLNRIISLLEEPERM